MLFIIHMIYSSLCMGRLLCLFPLLSLSSFLHKCVSPSCHPYPLRFSFILNVTPAPNGLLLFCSSPSPSVPVLITGPAYACALVALLPWLVVVFIYTIWISISSPFLTVFQFWAAVSQCKRGRWFSQCVRTKYKDKGHGGGRRAWRTKKELGQLRKIMDNG